MPIAVLIWRNTRKRKGVIGKNNKSVVLELTFFPYVEVLLFISSRV